jgi:DNA recombination protein RmuC
MSPPVSNMDHLDTTVTGRHGVTDILLIVVLVLLGLLVVVQLLMLRRKVEIDLDPIEAALQSVERSHERLDRSVRDEIAKNREEATTAARESRVELAGAVKAVGDTINQQLATLTVSNDKKLEQLRATVEQRLQLIQEDTGRRLEQVRKDSQDAAKALRDEIALTLKGFNESLVGSLGEIGKAQKTQLEVFSERLDRLTQTVDHKLASMRELIEQRLVVIQKESGDKLDQIRQESATGTQKAREEVTKALKEFGELSTKTLTEMGSNQRSQLTSVVEQLTRLTEAMEKRLDTQRTTIDARLQQIQTEATTNAKAMREEITNALKGFNDSVVKAMTGISDSQKAQLEKLTESNQQKLDALKAAVEEKLKALQEDNSRQLDQMRATVDEKLQGTLEKRLGESFKLVSERLEQVYKGLGEMQTLATGVGDLKKVLSNVKARGTFGEVQLGAMLEQVLTPDQFGTNITTKESGERVEFAVKFPGRGEDTGEVVWMPIDAKFPIEDYQRLVDAQDKADPEAAEAASKQLEARIRRCAKDICDKYINPPRTTDIGILFLPTEGLFAEVVRRIGLVESIHRDCHVLIAGPTTLYSLLSSFQMGFRTLTIERRSSEVWKLLSAVKTEFGKYGEVLNKVQKKLIEASDTIDKEVAVRTRVINRKLSTVEELPASGAKSILMLDASDNVTESDD